MLKTFVAGAAAALTLTGLALAVPQKDTVALEATLKARFEVPKPAGVRTGAVGLFTGKAVELENTATIEVVADADAWVCTRWGPGS